MLNLILSAIILGLLWSVSSVGLYITYRILNISDMTTEGSFPLGASLTIIAINHDITPVLSLLIAFVGGAFAGLITAFLTKKLEIPSLLAGILTMTGLYSINLRLMGRPNLSLLNKLSIFDKISGHNELKDAVSLWLGLTIVFILLLSLYFFLQTELGQALIASGDNPQMAASYGISTTLMHSLATMLANGIIALGGGLIAQYNGFSDINMGLGVIVVALASIIIGEVLFPNVSFGHRLVTIPIGSIIYRLLQLTVIRLKIISPEDFKLFSALIITLALAMPTIQNKFKQTEGGVSHEKN